MKRARFHSDESERRSQVILEVAKAISAHLELTDVLQALIARLKPTVVFDSVSVVVLDGDYAKIQSLHIEKLERKSHESVQSVLARSIADRAIEPLDARIHVSQHHMS